jgi:glycosyltransferase involved in cell wall biosynthesis
MPADSKALIVADSCWHSTRNLLATWPPASDPGAELLRLEPIDWRNAHARGVAWYKWGVRSEKVAAQVALTTAELPPGWMKTYPRLGQRPLARQARQWLGSLEPGPRQTTLWMTYPYYLALADMLAPDRLVYYNLDDYALYWPAKADDVRVWEARAVTRSDWTVCVAAERARLLREAFPERADRILHIPHGAPESTIPAEPFLEPGPTPPELAGVPRPILGYLGGLEDRVDWALVDRIAEAFPQASVVLVGPKANLDGTERWRTDARRAIARPNIYATGAVTQERTPRFYATFDVNLIPYDVSHPFNVVCSPTKLMDGMGCGRPCVATALPECRLYDGLYRVAETHEAFLENLVGLIDAGCRDGREQDRWRHARAHAAPIVLDKIFRLT